MGVSYYDSCKNCYRVHETKIEFNIDRVKIKRIMKRSFQIMIQNLIFKIKLRKIYLRKLIQIFKMICISQVIKEKKQILKS